MTEKIHAQALAMYAMGVQACSILGLPLSKLRIYYKVLSPSYWPVFYWIWNGTEWTLFKRTQEISRNKGTRDKIYRLGIWVEFETLDDAKLAGLRYRETKLCPTGRLDPAVWDTALTQSKEARR